MSHLTLQNWPLSSRITYSEVGQKMKERAHRLRTQWHKLWKTRMVGGIGLFWNGLRAIELQHNLLCFSLWSFWWLEAYSRVYFCSVGVCLNDCYWPDLQAWGAMISIVWYNMPSCRTKCPRCTKRLGNLGQNQSKNFIRIYLHDGHKSVNGNKGVYLVFWCVLQV